MAGVRNRKKPKSFAVMAGMTPVISVQVPPERSVNQPFPESSAGGEEKNEREKEGRGREGEQEGHIGMCGRESANIDSF